MKFNIKDLEAMVKEMNEPSVVFYCSSSVIDDLKERWDEKIARARFCLSPYDDGRIWIMPAKEIEIPIKYIAPDKEEEKNIERFFWR